MIDGEYTAIQRHAYREGGRESFKSALRRRKIWVCREKEMAMILTEMRRTTSNKCIYNAARARKNVYGTSQPVLTKTSSLDLLYRIGQRLKGTRRSINHDTIRNGMRKKRRHVKGDGGIYGAAGCLSFLTMVRITRQDSGGGVDHCVF